LTGNRKNILSLIGGGLPKKKVKENCSILVEQREKGGNFLQFSRKKSSFPGKERGDDGPVQLTFVQGKKGIIRMQKTFFHSRRKCLYLGGGEVCSLS